MQRDKFKEVLIYGYADSMTRYTGSFQILFLDCVLCRLTGKYHLSIWQGMQFLVSLIRRLSLLSITVLLGFGTKLIIILH